MGDGDAILLDDLQFDAPPVIDINDARSAGRGVNPNFAVFQVHLSKPAEDPVVVDYATEDGTAIAGRDYAAVGVGLATASAGGPLRAEHRPGQVILYWPAADGARIVEVREGLDGGSAWRTITPVPELVGAEFQMPSAGCYAVRRPDWRPGLHSRNRTAETPVALNPCGEVEA